MPDEQPLATLLSQVLVAFTIEFDNEFEHRMPHRTSLERAAGVPRKGPWLVSMAMWANCLSHLDAAGAPMHEVADLVAMTNLAGLERWGYVTVDRTAPRRRDHVVRPTTATLRANAIWAPLADEIEQRWRDRFDVHRLGAVLRALTSRFTMTLPRYLPVVNFADGMRTHVPDVRRDYDVNLPVLLSHALIAYTVEFEADAVVSLPMSANILRVLDTTGVPVRELPARSGVSKESIAAALRFLAKHGHVAVRPAATRGKVAVLTAQGQRTLDGYREGRVERAWRTRYGNDTIAEIRAALAPCTDEVLRQGLTPYPDGWRAALKQQPVLPHHPMVLHRGGYPDGS